MAEPVLTSSVVEPVDRTREIEDNIRTIRKALMAPGLNDKQKDALTEELKDLGRRQYATSLGADVAPGKAYQFGGTAAASPPDAGSGAYEFGQTRGGAATGRALVTAARPATEDTEASRVAGRIAAETTGATIGAAGGGALGSVMSRPFPGPSKTPIITGTMRFGEVLGTVGGSLAAELVDPTENPMQTAAQAATMTGLTGTFADAATTFARRLLGKPSEAGKALVDVMAKEGKVPPPGSVLDSTFAQSMQQIGSSSFILNEQLKHAIQTSKDVSSEALRNYVSSFQRYYDTAKLAFSRVDEATANLGPVVHMPYDIVRTIKPALDEFKKQNLDGKMPLARIYKIIEQAEEAGVAGKGLKLKMNFADAQELQNLVFEHATALRKAASRGDVEFSSSKLSEAAMDYAMQARKVIDDSIDQLIKDRKIPIEVRGQLAGARAAWAQWADGRLMGEMVQESTKDAAASLTQGTPQVRGQLILNKLDALIAKEKDLGKSLLSSEAKENLRRFALAEKAAEEGGKTGAFGIAGRGAPYLALTGLIHPTLGAIAAPIILTPPMIATLFSNQKAATLLLRGMRMEPGSAAAVRAGRELFTFMLNEGLIPPERDLGGDGRFIDPDSGELVVRQVPR